MMKFKLLLPIIVLIQSNLSSEETIKRYCLGEWCERIGYSEAVAVDQTLYLSGIVAEAETMDEAVTTALERLEYLLKFFKLERKHILKEKIYTNSKNELREVTEIRKGFYGKHLPAAIWIEAEQERKNSWLEIEYVIHIPEGHQLPSTD